MMTGSHFSSRDNAAQMSIKRVTCLLCAMPQDTPTATQSLGSCANASALSYAVSDRFKTPVGYSGGVSSLNGWVRPVRHSVQVGEHLQCQGISPAARS
jgi:hypothetical protein